MGDLKPAGDDTQAVTGQRLHLASVLGRSDRESHPLACAVWLFSVAVVMFYARSFDVLGQVPFSANRHSCSLRLKLSSGAMATTTGASAERKENPHISDEESEQDQTELIRDLVARIKELENKLSIIKDTEGNASTDNHDKLKPIDIKDIERPDMYDYEVAKFNTSFHKFKDWLTSRNGNWEKLLDLIENRGKVTIKNQKS